jgi:hypothetical protein
MRRMATFGAVCVVAAIVLLIVLAGGDNQPAAGTGPVGTVRQFLTVAAVENNGDVACRYLTNAEMLRVERAARETTSCGAAFSAGKLTIGGKSYGGDLKQLSFSGAENDGRAAVTVSAGGSTLLFRVVPATAGERNQFAAPATPWRIDSGAAAVVSH